MSLTTQRLDAAKAAAATAIEQPELLSAKASKTLIAADSGLTSTPLPPAVRASQTTVPGVLNARLNAKTDSVGHQLTAIAEKLEIAQHNALGAREAGALAADLMKTARNANGKSNAIVDACRSAVVDVALPVVDAVFSAMAPKANDSFADRAADNPAVRALLDDNVRGEYRALGQAMREIARGDDEAAGTVRHLFEQLSMRYAKRQETAWHEMCLAPSTLDVQERVATRLAANRATPETVDDVLEAVKTAIADGDGRFALAVLEALRAAIGPASGFSAAEVDALKDLMAALHVQAQSKAWKQQLGLSDLTATTLPSAEFEIRVVTKVIEALQWEKNVDTEYLKAACKVRDRMTARADAFGELRLDDAEAAFANAKSMLKVQTGIFDDAEEAHRFLGKRGVASAEAFTRTCTTRLSESQKTWDKYVFGMKNAAKGLPSETLAIADDTLTTMRHNFAKQMQIAGIDPNAHEAVQVALDFIDVRVTAFESLPKNERKKHSLDGAGVEASRYATSAKTPDDRARARTLAARAKALGVKI